MFEEFYYLAKRVFGDLDWFGLSDNQLVMGSFDFLVLLLGNNVFMVLLTFFLASRWGAENERKKNKYVKTRAERENVRVNFDHRVF